jgi:predicted metalloprotease with PDZ domain
MPVANRYVVSIPRPHSHLVEVEARFAELDGLPQTLDLHMAGWTPGSYLVRDYARHVEGLSAAAASGAPLTATKIDKATWRVDRRDAREIVVRYRVFAHELTVRTSHVDGTHAFLNGAPTFLWIDARRGTPHEVTLDLPTGWRVTTALHPSGERGYLAADLDELLDSPIHAAGGPVRELDAAGRPHELAVWGRPEPGAATLDDLAADTRRIVEAHVEVFGGVPYDRYAFILLLAPGAHGGLEHAASTALLSSPFAFSTRKKYEDLLELVSHEYFHLWNVKRIRPSGLGRFDYARENYTRALWVAEGLTSYYDRYTLRRARLQPVKRYLEKLAEEWGHLLAIPGRRKQSIEESSFDAWIKLYKPDENSVNSTVSYYLKGSIVCLCLDLEIRRRSGGRRSLDDVLRRLWAEYGALGRGYDDAHVQLEMEQAVDLDLGAFFDRSVRGREDPDLAAALAGAGLVLRPKREKRDEGEPERPPAWLGVNTRADAGRLVVASVPAGSPAEAAGLYAGDEIVAVAGWRVSDEKGLKDRIAARRPGEAVAITAFRRDEEQRVEVVLGDKPPAWEIVPADAAGDAERALHEAWLGEPWKQTVDGRR